MLQSPARVPDVPARFCPHPMRSDPIPVLAHCSDCDLLVQRPAAAAHTQLCLTDAWKRGGGLSRGVVFRYRCSQCASSWLRLADSSTGATRWSPAGDTAG